MKSRSPRRRGGVTRRQFVYGVGAAAAVVAVPTLWFRSAIADSPPPEQLHLQFGADASREVVASWATSGSVEKPRLRFGTPEGGFGRTVEALTRTYIDAASGTEVYTHHAVLRGLDPATSYVYEVLHDGATPLAGSFTTAPQGRAPIRFTSFGDEATPAGHALSSPWASYNPPQVEQLKPLFHLLNGDLSYANISADRVATWRDFFNNNQVSARNRPWMPTAGNHENELGNGPFGFLAYQTRFFLPNNDAEPPLNGMWYTFTAGPVQVIALNNDDICYQDGGGSYVHGYSQGAQKAWLERTLRAARDDDRIDWIVVCMHQVAISSVRNFNGADLGIRQEWLPLFDRYGVDLVVCGHEHHYERSLAIRGVDPAGSATLRPMPVSNDLTVIDTTKGTVHMVIGGGGTSAPSNGLFYDPPQCDVIVGVGAPPTPGGKRPSIKVTENAIWAGSRDRDHAYGFASFDVDPGQPGGNTTMTVTVHDTAPSTTGTPTVFERFVLQRSRRDGEGDEANSARRSVTPAGI